ncbi:hypothetical protein TNCV_2450141 [Trichonephila clavipes]|nr:hypothetical protein TNCV_2450141 [Trichonephila clavipes]
MSSLSVISPKNGPLKLQRWIHYTPFVTSHCQGHKSLHTALVLTSILFEWNSHSLSLDLLECTGARRSSAHIDTCPSCGHCFLKPLSHHPSRRQFPQSDMPRQMSPGGGTFMSITTSSYSVVPEAKQYTMITKPRALSPSHQL